MTIFAIVLIVIGAMILLAYVFSRVRCKTPVNAEISALKEKKVPVRGSIVTEYTPVISYTVEQKKYTETTNVSTRKNGYYSVGQKVTVYVDPKNPERFRYGSNIGILIFGLMISALGIFLLWVALL